MQQIVSYVEKPVSFTLFDARWIPLSKRLVVVGSHAKGTGIWQVYELKGDRLELLHQVDRPKAIKCSTVGASPSPRRQVALGDFDGNLSVWDVDREDSRPLYSTTAHSSIINSIDGAGGGFAGSGEGPPEVATASRDGSVKIWDVRQKDRPVAVMEPDHGQIRHDCWAVAFGNIHKSSERMVCAGFDNGDVKMFDLRLMKVHWETNVGNGVCSIEFDRRDIAMNKLTVCTLDSRIFVFDLRTRHDTKGFAVTRQKAHKSTVWTGKHLPQNRDLLITCGGNGTLCLWKYEYPDKRTAKSSDGKDEGVAGSLKLIEEAAVTPQPVTTLSWSQDFTGLAACTSFDQTIRILAVTGLGTL